MLFYKVEVVSSKTSNDYENILIYNGDRLLVDDMVNGFTTAKEYFIDYLGNLKVEKLTALGVSEWCITDKHGLIISQVHTNFEKANSQLLIFMASTIEQS